MGVTSVSSSNMRRAYKSSLPPLQEKTGQIEHQYAFRPSENWGYRANWHPKPRDTPWYLLTWSRSCWSHKLMLQTLWPGVRVRNSGEAVRIGGRGSHTSAGFTSRTVLGPHHQCGDTERSPLLWQGKGKVITVKHPRAVSKAKAFAPGQKTLLELSPSWERALLPLQPLLAFQTNLREKINRRSQLPGNRPGILQLGKGKGCRGEKAAPLAKHLWWSYLQTQNSHPPSYLTTTPTGSKYNKGVTAERAARHRLSGEGYSENPQVQRADKNKDTRRIWGLWHL